MTPKSRPIMISGIVGGIITLMSPSMAPAQSPQAGILPVFAPEAAAAHLDAALGRALAIRGAHTVAGPLETRRIIASRPKVQQAITEAETSLHQSRRQAFQMHRPQAVAAAKRAIVLLERARAPWYHPNLVAEAHRALALALLLQPASPDEAYLAFREAARLSNTPQKLTKDLPPKARRIFDRALKNKVPAPAPTRSDLQWIAIQTGMQTLIWIRLTAESGSAVPTLHATLFRPDRAQLLSASASIPPGATSRKASQADTQPAPTDLRAASLSAAAGLIHELLVHSRRAADDATPLSSRQAATTAVQPPLGYATGPEPTPTPKANHGPSWYQNYWLWTAVSVLVVGGAAAGIIYATQDSKSPRTTLQGPFEVEITLP